MREKSEKITKGGRNSNLELFRIITMVVIIAHHYVVNSGLSGMINETGKINFNSCFLLLFGLGKNRD